MGLKSFISQASLPRHESDILAVLREPGVEKIAHYVLGPRDISNIPQACQKWQARTGLADKSEMIEGVTPDVYIQQALADLRPGVVQLVWTCAVYGQEKDLFFGYLDTALFFVQEIMPLDHMQLATRADLLPAGYEQSVAKPLIDNLVLPADWIRLASHPSPKPLFSPLLENNQQAKWVAATSNGAAAEMCAAGEVELCICTEKARQETGLVRIWDFGTPDMVFFGGLTAHGAGIISQAFADVQEKRRAQYEESLKELVANG